ncbi:MAG: AbrB/MazE/SpoVT family DNA-binding domain-containing protein [Desertimonas sp.]
MSGTHQTVMGDRGRLVVPAAARERAGLEPGTPVVIVETEGGLILMTRGQLRDRVRREMSGLALVDELLAERRVAAASEDRP